MSLKYRRTIYCPIFSVYFSNVSEILYELLLPAQKLMKSISWNWLMSGVMLEGGSDDRVLNNQLK